MNIVTRYVPAERIGFPVAIKSKMSVCDMGISTRIDIHSMIGLRENGITCRIVARHRSMDHRFVSGDQIVGANLNAIA